MMNCIEGMKLSNNLHLMGHLLLCMIYPRNRWGALWDIRNDPIQLRCRILSRPIAQGDSPPRHFKERFKLQTD